MYFIINRIYENFDRLSTESPIRVYQTFQRARQLDLFIAKHYSFHGFGGSLMRKLNRKGNELPKEVFVWSKS